MRNKNFYKTLLFKQLNRHGDYGMKKMISKLWTLNLLTKSSQQSEVQRLIQIGLLCAYDDPADRPTMSTVVALLGCESMELPPPRQPVLSVGKVVPSGQSSTAPSVKMKLLFLLFHHGAD